MKRPLVGHPGAFHDDRIGGHGLQEVTVVIDVGLLRKVVLAVGPPEDPVDDLQDLLLQRDPDRFDGNDVVVDQDPPETLQRLFLAAERALEFRL